MQDISKGGHRVPPQHSSPQHSPAVQRAAAAFVVVAICAPGAKLLAENLRASFEVADTAPRDRTPILPSLAVGLPPLGAAITLDALPEGGYIGRDSGGNPVLILGGPKAACPRDLGKADLVKPDFGKPCPSVDKADPVPVVDTPVKQPTAAVITPTQKQEPAALPAHDAVPLARSDIQIAVAGLRFSNTGVSFTVDTSKVPTFQFLGATTGHLYSGAFDAGRKCPVVPIVKGQYTEREDGPLRHFAVRLAPDTVRLIREYKCSFHPKIRF